VRSNPWERRQLAGAHRTFALRERAHAERLVDQAGAFGAEAGQRFERA